MYSVHCVYAIDINFPLLFSQHGFAALMKDTAALTTMALSMFYGTHRYVRGWVWSMVYLQSYSVCENGVDSRIGI